MAVELFLPISLGLNAGCWSKITVDLLNAKSIAAAGDGAEVMRVEDVFDNNRETRLSLRRDQLQSIESLVSRHTGKKRQYLAGSGEEDAELEFKAGQDVFAG